MKMVNEENCFFVPCVNKKNGERVEVPVFKVFAADYKEAISKCAKGLDNEWEVDEKGGLTLCNLQKH